MAFWEWSDEATRFWHESAIRSKNEMLTSAQHDIKGLHAVSEMELSRGPSQGFLGRRFTARSK